MSDEPASPATFAELLNGGGTDVPICSRCGQPATHRLTLTARPKVARAAGPPTTASHRGDLCESHAVAVFAKFREVIR